MHHRVYPRQVFAGQHSLCPDQITHLGQNDFRYFEPCRLCQSKYLYTAIHNVFLSPFVFPAGTSPAIDCCPFRKGVE